MALGHSLILCAVSLPCSDAAFSQAESGIAGRIGPLELALPTRSATVSVYFRKQPRNDVQKIMTEPGICNIELTFLKLNTAWGAYSINCSTRSFGNRSRAEKEFIFLKKKSEKDEYSFTNTIDELK